MAHYRKPALSLQDQLGKLKMRGMVFADEGVAIQWLSTISYYRLSAYFYPFKQADESFAQGTSFETIRMLYSFDRKLRLLMLDAIERIEIALRTAITYHLSMKLGAFAHCRPEAFQTGFRHTDFMEEVRYAEAQSYETFVRHFRAKYTTERDLPIWMATELLSFGVVSRLLAYLRGDVLKQVARAFNTTEIFLASWMHSLSYVRNVCAHHGRFWNRRLTVKPKLPSAKPWFPYIVERNDSVYSVLVVVHHLLKAIAPTEQWANMVVDAFDQYPEVPLSSVGMPLDWKARHPWS
jgi:abortive infection bacteriophage resistance protein